MQDKIIACPECNAKIKSSGELYSNIVIAPCPKCHKTLLLFLGVLSKLDLKSIDANGIKTSSAEVIEEVEQICRNIAGMKIQRTLEEQKVRDDIVSHLLLCLQNEENGDIIAKYDYSKGVYSGGLQSGEDANKKESTPVAKTKNDPKDLITNGEVNRFIDNLNSLNSASDLEKM